MLGQSNYARIKSLKAGEKPSGDIWIRKTNSSNWNEVALFCFGTITNIGYINTEDSRILFKESLEQENYKEIRL